MPQQKRSGYRLFIILAALICLVFSQRYAKAAYLKNVPITLKQPNGSVIKCFATGDEFFHYFHDANGLLINRQPTTGSYVYVQQRNGAMLPSQYTVGSVNPRLLASQPSFKISSGLLNQARLNAINSATRLRSQQIPTSGSPIGTLTDIVIFIRFADDMEYTDNIYTYDNMFNGDGSTGPSLSSYYNSVSYGKLQIHAAFFPNASSSGGVLSFQDSHNRSYYEPYSFWNPGGYSGDYDRANREWTMLHNAVEAVKNDIPANLDIDANHDGYVDNVCFVVRGGPGDWGDLLWPHMWHLGIDTYINGAMVTNYNFQLRDFMLASGPHGGTQGVGVLSHEMFHSLGGPDLYHYYTGSYLEPVGGMGPHEPGRLR